MAARFQRFCSFGGMGLAAVLCVALTIGLLLAGRAQAAPFAAVVMDARSGEILHATNHDTRLHPASLTKMMTLYVVFEAIQNGEISLDTRVRVSRRAATEVPSRLGLREGQQIAVRHLIRGAALRSGNDAATALAEAISGSVEAFAVRMNRTAAAIGMSNTTFHNAHGLTQAGHLSTARDMTILGRQLYFDYPQYYNIFSRRTEDAGVAHVNNTNRRFLDGYRGADGIKTGFTNAAGYNLTAMAERNGVRIVVTVFGGRSVVHRHQEIVRLMDMGFSRAPNRVAVRRPSRPDYSRAPQVASAAGSAGGSSGTSAGRVIRLQTAPSRSPFPQRRPVPGETALPEELIASLQNNISSVLAEVVADQVTVAPAELAETALARSPVPQARPDESPADDDAVQVARAAGFNVIDPETYLDLTSEELGEMEAEDGVLLALHSATDLPELAEAVPPARPTEALDAPQEVAELAEALLDGAVSGTPETLATDSVAEMALAPDTLPEPAPRPLPTGQALLADVVVQEGLVMIPGLPALAFGADEAPAMLPSGQAATLALAEMSVRALDPLASPLPGEGALPVELATLLDHAERGMAADAPAGDDPVIDARIVLTASDGGEAPVPHAMPAPEVVTRVSTSGGRVWSVDLGLYPSRFDAERMLMRLALSESGTLGQGVRRVGQRSGRFVAGIHSLTQDQAELACLRLSARNQSCEVVHP